MKKTLVSLLALVLVLVLSLGAVAEVNLASGMPIVTEPVSVSIAMKLHGNAIYAEVNPATFWDCCYLDEVSGLDIEWSLLDPATAGEQISLMMAGDDMPDLLMGMSWNITKVSDYGMIQQKLYPVDTLLDYMPTLSAIMEKQPELKAVMTAPDGHMYCFPALGDGKYSYPLRYWLKKDWLENVDVEEPTTLDELYNVLCAFRDGDANGNGDPTDEIPFGGSWDEEYSERDFIVSSFGLANSSYGNLSIDYTADADANDRAIIYTPYAPEYKDYLEYMKLLWDEGLLDPDIFTQSQVQSNAKVNDNKVGIWGGSNPSGVISYMADAEKSFIAVAPVHDNDGNEPAINYFSLIYNFGQAVIKAGIEEEKAAALANLVDYMYTPDWHILQWYGPEEGSQYATDTVATYYHDGRMSYAFRGAEADTMGHWVFKVTKVHLWETPGYHTVGNAEYDIAWAAEHPDSLVAEKNEKSGGVYQVYEQLLNDKVIQYYKEGVPPMFFTEDDTERSNLLLDQLNSYVTTAEVKFICGELNLDEDYDAFIASLEDFGVNELEDIWNSYYDGYKANK